MKKRVLILMPFSLILAMMASSSGCRPDDVPPDSTIVVGDFTDSTDGIWVDDTSLTSYDMLLMYEQQLDDVFFGYNSYELSQEAISLMLENAAYIMATPGFRLMIEGHCDERGTIDYNLALGEHRALAAYNYLVNYGIPTSRLEYVSYGKERPFDPAHTEDAWALNRRAHFRALPEN
jgi:peptidoglycan-associated lipoprotein